MSCQQKQSNNIFSYSILSKMGALLSCPDYRIIVCQAVLLGLIISITMMGAFILILNKLVWGCLKCLCNKQLWDTQWVQDKFDAVVERVFDRILKKHRSQEEKNVYEVLNYKAPPFYNKLLLFTLVYLIIGAIAQFWDEFLLEESYDCTTDRFTCCFDEDLKSTQRLDCSNTSYLKDNNITSVVCYKFAFKLSSASASALGLVTSIVVSIFVITWCLLIISKGTRRTRYRTVLTVLIQIFAVLIVLTVTVILYLNKIQSHSAIINFSSSHRLFSSYGLVSKSIEISLISSLLLIYIIALPWYKFEKIQKDADDTNILYDSVP